MDETREGGRGGEGDGEEVVSSSSFSSFPSFPSCSQTTLLVKRKESGLTSRSSSFLFSLFFPASMPPLDEALAAESSTPEKMEALSWAAETAACRTAAREKKEEAKAGESG